jgi:hypothetical protein
VGVPSTPASFEGDAPPLDAPRRHGKGVRTFADGSRFHGEFVEGAFFGAAASTQPHRLSA